MDDFADPDPFASFATPPDPLDAHADAEHDGVVLLRAAAERLDAGDVPGAVEAARGARRRGVPAELAPYLAVVDGIARFLDGRAPDGAALLEQAWIDHPDVAALPAALGAIRTASGDGEGGAQVLYAALVSDDPDRSLAVHRRRLTLLLAAVRAGTSS